MERTDLFSLQEMLKAAVEDAVPGRVWVEAEIADISVRGNGHCYIDLCQTDDGEVIAKSRAVIWRSRHTLIAQQFRAVTGEDLAAGMKVLVRVQVSYHEIYGLTLVIDDVDPEYTIGGKEALRRKTVERLQEEGLMDLQKRKSLPVLPGVLAVVSAPDAAGYGDFCRHLHGNQYGFRYRADLFPAVMQGRDCPRSVLDALDGVLRSGVPYDAVLILRGGGSEMDLSCFDDYSLCAGIAKFPYPVLTAIGHDRDHHVADMVACASYKTPTALADLFIECYMSEDQRISALESRIGRAFINKLNALDAAIAEASSRIGRAVQARLSDANAKLDVLEVKIKATDPRNVLQKGYSLATDARGVRLRSVKGIGQGDRVNVLFADGSLGCRVEEAEQALRCAQGDK